MQKKYMFYIKIHTNIMNKTRTSNSKIKPSGVFSPPKSIAFATQKMAFHITKGHISY